MAEVYVCHMDNMRPDKPLPARFTGFRRVVLASDYDALAAEMAIYRADYENDPDVRPLQDRIRVLEQDVADVAKINVDLMKRNRSLEALVNCAINVCQRYVPPDGLSAHDAMGEMLLIFDGPAQRAAMPQTETACEPEATSKLAVQERNVLWMTCEAHRGQSWGAEIAMSTASHPMVLCPVCEQAARETKGEQG